MIKVRIFLMIIKRVYSPLIDILMYGGIPQRQLSLFACNIDMLCYSMCDEQQE